MAGWRSVTRASSWPTAPSTASPGRSGRLGSVLARIREQLRRQPERRGGPRRRENPCQHRCLLRSGPRRQSAWRRTHVPVRVSCWVRVPEHDLVEIDRLGLRAPVAIDAKARLCVDERRVVAAGAVVAIGHGPLIGAAERAVEPDVDAAAGAMRGIEAHLHRRPALAWEVAPADLLTHYYGRLGTGCASGHLREEAHVIAERPRFDLEKGAGVARPPRSARRRS